MICYASSAGFENLSAVDKNGLIRDVRRPVDRIEEAGSPCRAEGKLVPLPAPRTRHAIIRYQSWSSARIIFVMLVLSLVCALPGPLFAQTAVFAGAQRNISTPASANSIAVDAAGNIYFIDFVQDAHVMKIPVNGGSPIVLASGLNAPQGLAVDSQGNLYIADTPDNTVFELAAGSSVLSLVPTSGLETPIGLAVDAAGDLFIADNGNKRVVEIAAAGGAQTTLATFEVNPFDVAVDGNGNVYVSLLAFQLAEIPAGGSPIMLNLDFPVSEVIAADALGNVFVSNPDTLSLVELPAGGGAAITLASFPDYGGSLAVDHAGDIFVSGWPINQVVELETNSANFGTANVCPSSQSTPAPCSQTLTLNYTVTSPADLSVSQILTQGAAGLDFNLAAGTTCGAVTTGTSCVAVVTFTPTRPGLREGAIEIINSAGTVLATTYLHGTGMSPQIAFTSDAQTTVGSGLTYPTALAMDGAGDLYIADTINQRVVKVPAGGGSQIAIGIEGFPSGVAVDGAGNLFIANLNAGSVLEVFPGGTQATLPFGFNEPAGMAVDAAGDLFIAETANNRVLEIAPGGTPQPLQVTGLSGPSAVAVDAAGDVFIADNTNDRIVEVPVLGAQTTIGTGLSHPSGVAVDAAGDVFITDQGNNRVVEVPAGGGAQIQLGGELTNLSGIFVDSSGNVFISQDSKTTVIELPRSQPPALSFATTQFATTSVDSPQTVTVQNIGNQPLSLSDVSYPVDFPVDFSENGSEDLCIGMASVTPGQACDLPVNFTPLHLGSLKENLTITDNSLNATGATQSITLSGTSVSQPVAAVLTSPAPGSTFAGSSVSFTWTAASGATGYYLLIGSTGVGSNNIYNSAEKTVTSYTFTAMPTNGEAIYVRLITNFNGTWTHDDYTFTALAQASLTSPTQGSTFSGPSVTFMWTAAPGATSYYLLIGSTGVGSNNIYNSAPKTVTAYTFTAMPINGETIYVRLVTNLSGTWLDKDYTFKAAAPAAQISSPVAGSKLTSPSVAFTWTAASGATGYYLWIGSTGLGSNNLYNSALKTGTSYTFTNAPTNGETIYVRLITDYNGTWVSMDYTYTAAKQAVMTAPTAGSVLAGASVTFDWTTATGATGYFLQIGSTGVGSDDIYNSAEKTVTTYTFTKMPTNAEKIYVRLTTNFNGIWVANDYTYTAAP